MKHLLKKLIAILIFQSLIVMPVLALDLDSTVTDKSRQNYGTATQTTQPTTQTTQTKSEIKQKTKETEIKPEIKQDLPKVPALPKNTNSSTVAPINKEYSGKMPNSDALIPCTDIVVKELIVDESAIKSKPATTKQTKTKVVKTPKYKTARLAKGTQVRVINKTKITDNLVEGQTITFLSTQEIQTAYFKIPKNTIFTARVLSSHKPQMTCNGGLVGLRIVSANINGYTQNINAGIIKLNTTNIHFSNLKGKHTYGKNVGKKAKWGQNICSKWIKTSHKLANKGPGIIIAPFPYVAGCVVAAASTVSAPATALLAKGGNLVIPERTSFTIKFYEDANLRY